LIDLVFILYKYDTYNQANNSCGIQSDGIPLGSKILAVADAFDSMTSGQSPQGTLIPKLNFTHQSIIRISQRAFGESRAEDGDALIDEIYEIADEIRAPLRSFIRAKKLDLIVVQNALTIPMNLPLGVSLTGLIAELGIAT